MKAKCLARQRKERLDEIVNQYEKGEIDINKLEKLGRLVDTEIKDAKSSVAFSVKFGMVPFCEEQYTD